MDKNTILFDNLEIEKEKKTGEILITVYKALEERGYNPVDQLVGYIISGDPSYITSNHNARNLIRHIDRDEIVEELLVHYVKTKK